MPWRFIAANLGPGILNALFAMNRATDMAEKIGLAVVSLKNTTHWMRGGAYGWLAAEKGFLRVAGPTPNLVCHHGRNSFRKRHW
ncbi:MAG: Ldh family oxidoreductase [Spirosomataceae bacterium]